MNQPVDVVFRLVEGAHLPDPFGPASYAGPTTGTVAPGASGLGPTTLNPGPLITTLSRSEILELEARAASNREFAPLVSLTGYWVVAVAAGRLAEMLAWLASHPAVFADVHVDRPTVEPTDDLSPAQSYLAESGVGIGVKAWRALGWDGAGATLVDIERGWNLAHEDLPPGITLVSGVNVADEVDPDTYDSRVAHGTAVLGVTVAVAQSTPMGVIGIAAGCDDVRLHSLHDGADGRRLVDLLALCTSLPVGAVVLVEQQVDLDPDPDDDVQDFRLVEWVPETFHAIRLLSALGMVVIEPAGNTSVEILFPPLHPGLAADSGAIVVAAGTTHVDGDETRHKKLSSSAFGERVDCYAVGQDLQTTGDFTMSGVDPTGDPDTAYTRVFGQTSGTSAIIAGAALLIQARRKAMGQSLLGASSMRALLKVGGLPNVDGDNDSFGNRFQIGVMPDLAVIAEHLDAPDVYMRDRLDDDGLPPSVGVVSASPDIAWSHFRLPPAFFEASPGYGPGRRMSHAPHWLYVRVANRGTEAAGRTRVRLYIAPAATVPMPATWHFVTSFSLGSVPNDGARHAPAPYHWSVPPNMEGHYCFIAVTDTGRDPAPETPPPLLDPGDFATWVRNNNNVAWRNLWIDPPGFELPSFEIAPLHGGVNIFASHNPDQQFGLEVGWQAGAYIRRVAWGVEVADGPGKKALVLLRRGLTRLPWLPMFEPEVRWVSRWPTRTGERLDLVQTAGLLRVGGVHLRIGPPPIETGPLL